ncbi:MFS transporter [Alicyclobacillus sp. ALC3]|uniref:MFS transporter n=1 Tax=Alicyclobacillus sp. ALC3 TaxID=2796143 RepID=UPI0023795A10|nr:MFS transporter [Alicyclobacillus sp. ALC3]WDL96687.1 MFS transporter [Alicyclobacillus sp. ALC3]
MGGGEQKMCFGNGVIPQEHARTFVSLICAAMAVTFSQGLMIPWMASVEAGHISPLMNSLSTSDTYAGLLVAMAFVGRLSRRIGLHSLLVWALAAGTLSICTFVVADNVQWWLLFRVVFGLSLGAIHFGTQSWIGRLATPEHRGKQMALYGLATGIGFAVGPMFLGTGKLAEWLPFILSACTFVISLVLVMRLPRIGKLHQARGAQLMSIRRIYRVALPALALPLVFGFMESTLNGDLPLFAERVHLPLAVVSASLAGFVVGSLVFQLPLGHLSDRLGRRTVLIGCSAVGVVLFGVLPWVAGSNVTFIALCFVVGAFLDTLFSLSLGFLGDLVGGNNLPTANQLAVTHLGLGLMIGPMVGGLTMAWLGPGGMFWAMAFLYLIFVGIIMIWRPIATSDHYESMNASV